MSGVSKGLTWLMGPLTVGKTDEALDLQP